MVECIGGRQHLRFNVDAKVFHAEEEDTYGEPVVGRKNNCDLKVLWDSVKVGSINTLVQKMAKRLEIVNI